MTLSNFISKLNWRLVLVHTLACWLFVHGLRQLGYLYDYNYLEKIIYHDYKGLDGERLSMDLYYRALFGLAGLLIAFGISLMLSLKFKWYWVNSIIVLLATSILLYLDRFYWGKIKFIMMAPGRVFHSDWAYVLTNGMIMLVIGLLLFFSKRIRKFIDGMHRKSMLTV